MGHGTVVCSYLSLLLPTATADKSSNIGSTTVPLQYYVTGIATILPTSLCYYDQATLTTTTISISPPTPVFVLGGS
jgi:hypothetical protein